MKWEVAGADRVSGRDVKVVVEADDESSARRRANRQGILVGDVRPIEDDDSIHGTIVTRPQNVAVERKTPPPFPQMPIIVPMPTVNVGIAMHNSGTSGFGIAALVLGIIACLTAWIPFVGIFSIPLSCIGLLLAFIGLLVSLIGKKSSVGMPVAGGSICVLALILAIVVTGGTASVIGAAAAEANKAAEERAKMRSNVSQPAIAENAGAVSVNVPPATPPPEPVWIQASSAAKLGDVTVMIESARIGKVAIRSLGADSNSKDAQLTIVVRLLNNSSTAKRNYRTWGAEAFSSGDDRAALIDEHHNSYKPIAFGFGAEVGGRVKNESIYPTKSITDVLVFEAPIAAAKSLRLELPAKNFGELGIIRFEIPRSMVTRDSVLTD